MDRKRIMTENSLHQSQEFVIVEYENHIEIGRFLSEENEKVEIPETIDGKPVTAIGDICFRGCIKLKEVILPNTIETIGIDAFGECKGLTVITLPNSVKEIGHHAFRDCRSLKKVVFPKDLKRLPWGVLSFSYLHDPEIVLPEGLKVIESGAFYSGGSFDLLIPDSVKEIGVGAFCHGPTPITKLPYNKGWFLTFPYGEKVTAGYLQGEITDIHYLHDGCELYEMTADSEKKVFFFPCDYIDGMISFVNEKVQETAANRIKEWLESETKLHNAYQLRDAWRKGLVETI